MPLTAKGQTIKRKMDQEYGNEKADRVFYASKNKGTITGVDRAAFRSTIRDAMAKGLSASDAIAQGLSGKEPKGLSLLDAIRDSAAEMMPRRMAAKDILADAMAKAGPNNFSRDYGVPGMKKGQRKAPQQQEHPLWGAARMKSASEEAGHAQRRQANAAHQQKMRQAAAAEEANLRSGKHNPLWNHDAGCSCGGHTRDALQQLRDAWSAPRKRARRK